jgi:hypothetical protein
MAKPSKPLCPNCRANLQTLDGAAAVTEVAFDHKRNSLIVLSDHAFEITMTQLESLSKLHRAQRRKDKVKV